MGDTTVATSIEVAIEVEKLLHLAGWKKLVVEKTSIGYKIRPIE